MTSKISTLAELIAETYTDMDTKYFVLCDAGNGCAFGEAGQTLEYDDRAAALYANIEMRPTEPHMSEDRVECVYASDWIDGENGYRYQVRF